MLDPEGEFVVNNIFWDRRQIEGEVTISEDRSDGVIPNRQVTMDESFEVESKKNKKK